MSEVEIVIVVRNVFEGRRGAKLDIGTDRRRNIESCRQRADRKQRVAASAHVLSRHGADSRDAKRATDKNHRDEVLRSGV